MKKLYDAVWMQRMYVCDEPGELPVRLIFSYPEPKANVHCNCVGNAMGGMFCAYGHMLECHYPYNCEDAGCGHLTRYDFTIEAAVAFQDAAGRRIAAGEMPGYALEDGRIVAVKFEPDGELFFFTEGASLKGGAMSDLDVDYQAEIRAYCVEVWIPYEKDGQDYVFTCWLLHVAPNQPAIFEMKVLDLIKAGLYKRFVLKESPPSQ